MIKIISFLFLISNVVMCIEMTEQTLDKMILNFYEKNKNPVCDFNINENIKSVELLYDGNIYKGFLNEKKEPYGEWTSKKGFSVECYLGNRGTNRKLTKIYAKEL